MNRLSSIAATLFVLLVSCSGYAAAPPVGLAPQLQPYVDKHIMAGAVLLLADKNHVLDLEAIGYSDLAAKKPMRTDNVFWIASMSKPIAVSALMMLVDEGRLTVDDPVEKYLPEFKHLQVAQSDGKLVPPSHPIKIREILTHTSGLHFLSKADHSIIDSVPLDLSIQHDLLEPLLFDPGTKFLYSNEGMDTVGRIVEIVSGIPYEKFLHDRLLAPLGMLDTTFHPTKDQLDRLAKSYKADKSKPDQPALEEARIVFLKYPLDDPHRYPSPGGGLFSTADHDVCRFCQMLANGGSLDGKTYLSPNTVHQMSIKQTGPAVPINYGFGLMASDGGSFGHGGAYRTEMTVDHGLIRIFLVQQASDWASGNPSRDFDNAVHRLYPTTGPAPDSSTQIGTQVPSK